MRSEAVPLTARFHHPTHVNVNTCLLPVCPMAYATQGRTQKDIPFVYAPYVYLKMLPYANVTAVFSATFSPACGTLGDGYHTVFHYSA